MGCFNSKDAGVDERTLNPVHLTLGPDQRNYDVDESGKKKEVLEFSAPVGRTIKGVDTMTYVKRVGGGKLKHTNTIRAVSTFEEKSDTSHSDTSQWGGNASLSAGVTGVGGAELGAGASGGKGASAAAHVQTSRTTNVDVARFSYEGTSAGSSAYGSVIVTLEPDKAGAATAQADKEAESGHEDRPAVDG